VSSPQSSILSFTSPLAKIVSWCLLSRPGVGKHFLQRATLKILLLLRAACSYYIYYIYNRFENFKIVLHELPQNEGNNSHFQLSTNGVSHETCGKKLDNSNLIDKIT